MGDIADYYRDMAEEREIMSVPTRLMKNEKPKPHEMIWLTAHRKEIKFGDMSVDHLKNTIRALKEKRIHMAKAERKRVIKNMTIVLLDKLRQSDCDASEIDLY